MFDYNHFDLIDAYFIKFCLPNLLWNGHYNTSFHVIIISMYYWNLGLGHKLISKFFTNV